MGSTSDREYRMTAAGMPDYPPQGDESWRTSIPPMMPKAVAKPKRSHKAKGREGSRPM